MGKGQCRWKRSNSDRGDWANNFGKACRPSHRHNCQFCYTSNSTIFRESTPTFYFQCRMSMSVSLQHTQNKIHVASPNDMLKCTYVRVCYAQECQFALTCTERNSCVTCTNSRGYRMHLYALPNDRQGRTALLDNRGRVRQRGWFSATYVFCRVEY